MKSFKVGESISTAANIGIIIGLVFVGLEVRNARTATELQTVSDVHNASFALNDVLVRDTETARIILVGLYNPDALSTVEAGQFSVYLTMFGNNVVRIRRHYERGMVTRAEWEAARSRYVWLLQTPGGRRYLESQPSFDEATWLEQNEAFMDAEEGPGAFLLGRDPSTLE